MSTIGQRLAAARRARFVGRHHELGLFAAALKAPEAPFAVLFVHGPPGVGKTALLDAFAEQATAAGAHPMRIDGRDIEPTPAGFVAACGLETAVEDRLPVQLSVEGRPVILVDTFELLDPLEVWLREQFLLRLPGDALVVVAGRHGPSMGWRTAPGWNDLLRAVSLSNLEPQEVRAYLDMADVDEALHDELMAVTHGHPLALSLVVDVLAQRGAGHDLSLAHAPDVVQVLLQRFVEHLPTPDHRQALDTCALARVTTEHHLRATVGREDVADLFDWLRGLSFIQQGPAGLFPHDLVRDVLTADLRLRDAERFRGLMLTLVRSAGHELRRRFTTHAPRQVALDLLFTFRTHPRLGRHWDFERLETLHAEPVEPADFRAITEMVEANDGRLNASAVAHWLARSPDSFRVSRDPSGAIETVISWLELHEADASDLAGDPVSKTLWKYTQEHGTGESRQPVTVVRFAGPSTTAVERRRLLNLASLECFRRLFSRSAIGWNFIVVRDPAWWKPLFDHLGYEHTPSLEALFDDGHRHGAFGHDWRSIPTAWSGFLDAANWRQPPSPGGGSTIELSRDEFAVATRHALRDLRRPDELARSPLVNTRLVQSQAGDRPLDEIVASLLVQAIEVLFADPRDEKLQRVVDRTYLRPAPTQERAAELLDLPFSTYRRHLTRATARIADWMWDQARTAGSDHRHTDPRSDESVRG